MSMCDSNNTREEDAFVDRQNAFVDRGRQGQRRRRDSCRDNGEHHQRCVHAACIMKWGIPTNLSCYLVLRQAAAPLPQACCSVTRSSCPETGTVRGLHARLVALVTTCHLVVAMLSVIPQPEARYIVSTRKVTMGGCAGRKLTFVAAHGLPSTALPTAKASRALLDQLPGKRRRYRRLLPPPPCRQGRACSGNEYECLYPQRGR